MPAIIPKRSREAQIELSRQNAKSARTEASASWTAHLSRPVPQQMMQLRLGRHFDKIHGSHHLSSVNEYVFCTHCGCYMHLRPVLFRKRCEGIMNTNSLSQLNRMQKGLHPKKGAAWHDGSSGDQVNPVRRMEA